MSDISDDENSPNYERIHAGHCSVDQAMIAYNFVRALQPGSALTLCIMPLVLDATSVVPLQTIQSMMQKARSQSLEARRDLKHTGDIWMSIWTRSQIRSFGQSCITARQRTAWRWIRMSLEVCPVAIWFTEFSCSNESCKWAMRPTRRVTWISVRS